MEDNPKLEIKIQGHICCNYPVEDDGFDYDNGDTHLSVNRAKAVYDYLVAHGIDPNRMSYEGLGGKFHLVNPEKTEADMTKNRRVEIKIIKK